MRVLSTAALCALLIASSIAFAQAPPAPSSTKPDPNSSSQSGRAQLNKYLNDIAAQHTSTRRAAIAAITTRAQAETRQHEVRSQLLYLLGGGFEKTPLSAKVLGSTQLEGFRMEKVLFDSQPNFPVTALLYLPDPSASKKLPAVVITPGHAASGKASDYILASKLARNGFAVLSYDPIGEGE